MEHFDKDSLVAALTGAAGGPFAESINSFITYQDSLPSFNSIRTNPQGAMVPDSAGVNFVSRSSQNLGVSEKVKSLEETAPYQEGLITVTLGGSYLLSAFVQPEPFYTAQNIKVLTSKIELTFDQLVFYCVCITANRFKYSSHGREANRSLDHLDVPIVESIPEWVSSLDSSVLLASADHSARFVSFPVKWTTLK